MRKNSKDYFINTIRSNADQGIQFLRTVEKPNGIQKIAYDESHRMLNYFGITGGKKYPLKYLKEQSVYSLIVLNSMLTGEKQEGFIC
jgi:hypothetical protein